MNKKYRTAIRVPQLNGEAAESSMQKITAADLEAAVHFCG
jgi:hypothetical protein